MRQTKLVHLLLRFALTVTLLCPQLLRAQQPADPEIEELESAYRAQLVEIRKDLGAKWLDALDKLKNELTRDQNFAEAVLVRDEQTRVEAILEANPLPAATGTAQAQKVVLRPAAATLDGGLQLLRDGSLIGQWREEGGAAAWEVPADISPGTYELIIYFRCGDGGGGTFRVEIGDDQDLAGRVSASGSDSSSGWRDERSVLVGECVLNEHTGKLKIISSEHQGDLMNLASIELAPQGTWAGMQSGAADPDTPARDQLRGFKKLEGARWVDRDDRRSGTITVRHEDREHSFSLYFVQLLPTGEPERGFARAALWKLVKQLGTTRDKIYREGKKIDAALRDELWSEDLTIYTRWESRGKAGRNLAFVLVGDSPLSLSLVEKGFARTGGSYASEAPFIGDTKNSAKEFMKQLQAAEATARKARRGLWGL